MSPRRFFTHTRILIVCLLLIYWGGGLCQLTVLPRVYEDEPWLASTAVKFAGTGVFGSDMFAGFAHMEQRYYDFLPLYPFAMAAVFRVADVGLFQARWFGIVCGVIILALTFTLAQRVWHNERIGVLAVLFLLGVRWFPETDLSPTGILFFDATRVARYDVLVSVLGLAALHAYLSAQTYKRAKWFFVTGLLGGLCGLANLYGLAILPVIAILVLLRREPDGDRQSALAAVQQERIAREGSPFAPKLPGKKLDITTQFHVAALLAGAALPCLLYLPYVLGDVEAWRAQTHWYAQRFDMLNPLWYLADAQTELRRYALDWSSLPSWDRFGFWFPFVALPLVWIAWLLRARQAPRARVIFWVLALLPVEFALLLQVKFTNYLLLLAPIAALATAWGVVSAWGAFARVRWLRAVVAVAVVLVLAEGGARWLAFQQRALQTTPYARFNAQLRAFVPVGARVLALHRYWFGWQAYEYHSLAVPIWLTNPKVNDPPVPLRDALNGRNADYLIMDDASRAYFTGAPYGIGNQFRDWLKSRRAKQVGTLRDSTYGFFEIYYLPPLSLSHLQRAEMMN